MNRTMMRIERWTPDQLERRQDDWSALLARSDADPLACSPEWLLAWWEIHAPLLDLEPVFLAAMRQDELAGLGLFSLSDVRHKGGLRGRRLELVGNAWRREGMGVSERAGLVVDRHDDEQIAGALLAHAFEIGGFDDMVVHYAELGSATDRAVSAMAREVSGYLRRADALEAWAVPLEAGFKSFVGKLGTGTRVRVMGGRRRMKIAGHVRERRSDAGTLDDFLQVMDGLHRERWGRPLFNGPWGDFHAEIAHRQTARGVPVVSLLEFDGQPVSAMLNFRAGRTEYTLQSALTESPVRRASPGWVHLGFAIERAAADGIAWFDLL
ncbi:MAG: GNAT family N-acetyltransferase, partial [Gammaproteobacteria bacterium]